MGEHDGLIDARALLASTTVEELAAKADELVTSMEDPSALLAKPVSTMQEAPDVLACFGMLLGALAPLPEMEVLDFGAGSCWTTHFLAQLGCRVTAVDLSEAMLDLGRRRFAEQPLFGERPGPKFLRFDGYKLELPDDSIDRIVCFDALHHVAGVDRVLAEMARVLRPGGVAGFSEPGPNHSRDPQSQHEMRRYGVPECDVVMEEIWRFAEDAGFASVDVAVFSPTARFVPMGEFESFLAAGSRPGVMARVAGRLDGRGGAMGARAAKGLRLVDEYRAPAVARAAARQLAFTRGVLSNRRMFLLRMPGSEIVDSREATGLACELSLSDLRIELDGGVAVVTGSVRVENTGRNRWLPSSADLGAVRLGLRVAHGDHPAADHGRVALPGDGPFDPGAVVDVALRTEVPAPKAGEDTVRLELDLVAEGISWFASVKGHPVEVPIPFAS